MKLLLLNNSAQMHRNRNHNAWSEVTSTDAIEYTALRNVFNSLMFSNPNYADWSNTDFSNGSGPPQQMSTFKEGFQEVPLRMARIFLLKKK